MSKKKAIRELLLAELDQPLDPDVDYPFLDDVPQAERDLLTKGGLFVKVLLGKALRGDSKSIQEVLDRMYGKAPQHITQDVSVKSYTGFLEGLAALPDAEFTQVEDEEEEVVQLPILPSSTPVDIFEGVEIPEEDTPFKDFGL